MSIRLVYGRSGTGKSSYIFKKIKEEIDNGRKKIHNNARAVFIYS